MEGFLQSAGFGVEERAGLGEPCWLGVSVSIF